ncbi:MAG: hypothetical protein WCT26_02900 [Candidatus Buchananbacteria bacterium]
MQKILSFFKQTAVKIGELFKALKDKIFKRQAEEERQKKIIRGVILGIIIALVVILIGWYAAAKFWPKPPQDLNATATAPLAEAKLTVVTSRSCGKTCWDTQLFSDALAAQGIKIVDKETVNVGGWWPFGQGADVIKKYSITKVPTVIVEFKGANQPDINKFFSQTLGIVVDGKFVLTKILAPYYDLTAKKIKGIIKVTYLTDNSCAECYDVKKHETALKNLGAETANSETIDISSPAGQALVNQYKITKVPTLLVTGEVSEYTILNQAWSEVGTIASDGAYIFTNLDLMGDSYKDLTTGKIIKAKEIPASTAPAAAVPATKK